MLAASAGAPAVLVSVAFIPLLSLAANGRLKRNQWVGIRTAHTMRNDQAWIAGHRAALRLAQLFVCGTVLLRRSGRGSNLRDTHNRHDHRIRFCGRSACCVLVQRGSCQPGCEVEGR
jgi:hypothetical protein